MTPALTLEDKAEMELKYEEKDDFPDAMTVRPVMPIEKNNSMTMSSNENILNEPKDEEIKELKPVPVVQNYKMLEPMDEESDEQQKPQSSLFNML